MTTIARGHRTAGQKPGNRLSLLACGFVRLCFSLFWSPQHLLDAVRVPAILIAIRLGAHLTNQGEQARGLFRGQLEEQVQRAGRRGELLAAPPGAIQVAPPGAIQVARLGLQAARPGTLWARPTLAQPVHRGAPAIQAGSAHRLTHATWAIALCSAVAAERPPTEVQLLCPLADRLPLAVPATRHWAGR
jgi:hypothetical protein